jgi:ABC-2 type transport system ATP-binding protein
VLDEPVASLDPVARLEFMGGLMAAVADRALTVIISSHVVTELERVCDWVIVLAGGTVRAAGPVDELIAGHRLLTGPRTAPHEGVPGVVHRADSDRHCTLIVRVDPRDPAVHPAWQARPVGFEQLVLAYLQGPPAAPPPDDHEAGRARGRTFRAVAR